MNSLKSGRMSRIAKAFAVGGAVLFASTLSAFALAGEEAPRAAPAIANSAADAPPADSAAPDQGPHYAWQGGPEHIDLGHELELDLPEPYGYLPNPDATKFMEKMGNLHNETLIGVIVPKGDAEWLIVLRFVDDGYIKDDESLDADEILKSIKEGTEEGNKERVERGFKAMHVDGWLEQPRYDKAKHQLIWAIDAHTDDAKTVNYNTRILGRRGYISVNLITEPEALSVDRPNAGTILDATHFKRGARYEDFDSKKDKVAEYGLAGLVLAGAGLGALKLVKLGLLAKFSKVIIGLLIAGKKVVVGAIVALVAGIKALFNRGKKDQQRPPA